MSDKNKEDILDFIRDFHQFMLNHYSGFRFHDALPLAVAEYKGNLCSEYVEVLQKMPDAGCIAKSVANYVR